MAELTGSQGSATGSETLSDGVAVTVDFDAGVWLAGPTDGDAEGWTSGALAAVCSDFGVAAGSPAQDLLREVLHAFATTDLGCDFRFLRLRSLAEPIVVAMLHIRVADPDTDPTESADAVLAFREPGVRWYEGDTGGRPGTGSELVVVDETTGLRRAVRYAVDDAGRPSSVIRYHRRVPDLAADVVLSSAGADLRTTALVLDDLDDLARAVHLVDGSGRQW